MLGLLVVGWLAFWLVDLSGRRWWRLVGVVADGGKEDWSPWPDLNYHLDE